MDANANLADAVEARSSYVITAIRLAAPTGARRANQATSRARRTTGLGSRRPNASLARRQESSLLGLTEPRENCLMLADCAVWVGNQRSRSARASNIAMHGCSRIRTICAVRATQQRPFRCSCFCPAISDKITKMASITRTAEPTGALLRRLTYSCSGSSSSY